MVKAATDISSPSDIHRERLERYNHVVSAAQLRSVQMSSTAFKVKPDFFSDGENRKLSYTVIKGARHFSEENAVAMAFISFQVEAKIGRKKVLHCEAEYVVTYDGLFDCEEEAVLAFLDRVGPFTCYPYFRSLFASLDWAATTGLPPLPVHKEPPRGASPSGAKRQRVEGKKKD